MADRDDELLTRAEVASILRVSLATVNRLLNDGSLYRVHVGRQVRIPRRSLDAFLRGERWPDEPPDELLRPDETTWPPTIPIFQLPPMEG